MKLGVKRSIVTVGMGIAIGQVDSFGLRGEKRWSVSSKQRDGDKPKRNR